LVTAAFRWQSQRAASARKFVAAYGEDAPEAEVRCDDDEWPVWI
jgi:hypothetical protein